MHTTLLISNPVPAPPQGDDRSTTFQPVEGGTEHKSGEGLLVASYAGLWAILLVWVFFQWTKQTALARRIEGLEAAVAGAARAKAPAGVSDKGPAQPAAKPTAEGAG